jgi:DNA adenine methylase
MKPIVKWVGGKSSSISKIRELLPPTYNKYYEPFLGGGAVLLDLCPEEAVVNDINPELINMYLQVRDNVEVVIRELEKLDCCHEAYVLPKDFYYLVRKDFNDLRGDQTPTQAARFIYLNKHCFNGLYRVNSKGEFNVPFNGKLTGGSFHAEHLREVSKQIQNVEFLCGDFEKAVMNAEAGDLIYFDPPYDYEDEAGFVDYAKGGWSLEITTKLKLLCNQLVDRGCNILVSNNSTTFVRELFNDDRYSIVEIPARRAINRNGAGRGPVPEIIIQSKNCINNIC